MLDRPLIESLPSPKEVRHRLGNALREVELLRRLLRMAEIADKYRRLDSELVASKFIVVKGSAPCSSTVSKSPTPIPPK